MSEIERNRSLKPIVLAVLVCLLGLLIAPLCLDYFAKRQRTEAGKSLMALNSAAIAAAEKQLFPRPGDNPSAIAAWYREIGVLPKTGTSAFGLYYANGKWLVSGIKELPDKWAGLLLSGKLAPAQISEMLVRFREMDCGTVLAMESQGMLYITPDARKSCVDGNSAAELIITGNTLFVPNDGKALRDAVADFSINSPNAIFASSWATMLRGGESAGAWLPASGGGAVFSLRAASQSSRDTQSAELEHAIERFPPGSSVRELLDSAMSIPQDDIKSSARLLSDAATLWGGSSAPEATAGWAAELIGIYKQVRDAAPELFSEMAVILAENKEKPIVVRFGESDSTGSIAIVESEVRAASGRTYYIRTASYSFSKFPDMSQTIQTVRCMEQLDFGTLVLMSQRKIKAGKSATQNTVTVARAWNLRDSNFSIQSIVGQGTSKTENGTVSWQSGEPWAASSSIGQAGYCNFAVRGLPISPKNAYYWTVEAPFIKKIMAVSNTILQ